MNLKEILSKLNIVSSVPLNKGWSKDKKYILTDKSGVKLMLRLSDSSLFEKKKSQFEMLTSLESLDIFCSRPIDFVTLDDGTVCMILSYLSGKDGETALMDMNSTEAYRLGIEAGAVLKRLHAVSLPAQEKTWFERYLEKFPRKISALENCEYRIPLQEEILDFYKANYTLMKNRPTVLCHGDYHLGNMIVSDGKIGVIDFDKVGAADPYDDLKPYCWNVMVNGYFETGLIDGYFEGNVPDDFFPLLKFYTAESLISHLPWAVTFGDRETETARKVANNVMIWYGEFKLDVPTWYKKP